jgi:hypothetical protein
MSSTSQNLRKKPAFNTLNESDIQSTGTYRTTDNATRNAYTAMSSSGTESKQAATSATMDTADGTDARGTKYTYKSYAGQAPKTLQSMLPEGMGDDQ